MTLSRLPHKTVERLSQYRNALMDCLESGKHFIFSHELGNIVHVTPVQIRRDLMLIGYSGTLRKGYDISELIKLIGKILDPSEIQNIALIGIGNLGRAIISHFNGKRPQLVIVAAFDNDPNKADRVINGVSCYHIDHLKDIVKRENVMMAILTVPPEAAPHIAETLVFGGIKGIINFTGTPLKVPHNVYLEEYDIITSIEKTSYFTHKAV
jgi:redox-sensing transcriptional repressor